MHWSKAKRSGAEWGFWSESRWPPSKSTGIKNGTCTYAGAILLLIKRTKSKHYDALRTSQMPTAPPLDAIIEFAKHLHFVANFD